MAPPPRAANEASISTGAHSPSSDRSATEYRPGPSNERKRKATASGTSSRGVANLTPEQLAKKRANDREAQRAIRERTKNQIETLETTIKELTSQQPYQELQQALRQKELVEIENVEIKRRLAAVLELIQPILGNGTLGESIRSTAQVDGASQPPHSATSYGQVHSPVQYSATRRTSAEPLTARSSAEPWSNALAQVQAAPLQASSPLASRVERSPPSERQGRAKNTSETMASIFRTTSAERQALGLLPVGRPEIQSGAHVAEKPGTSPITSPALHAAALSTAPSQTQYQAQTPPNLYEPPSPRPPFITLPRNCSPSTTLDSLILDFISERRSRLAEGISSHDVLGPPYPSFSAILHPERRLSCHPMSAFFRDILSTFPDICAPPEKVAVSYVMFLIMRWHCHPTAETFERLPYWVKPTSWQVTMLHPIWIDHLPWPEMRNEIVKNQQRVLFESFFVPYTGTLSLNWPFGEREVFGQGATGVTVAEGAAAGDELVMSRAFEAHLFNLDNWSLGPAFAQEFPMLVASVRMEDKRRHLEGK